MKRILLLFGILILLIGCESTYIKKNSKFEIKDEFVNLFTFIGEKISIIEFDPNENNTRIVIDSISGDTIRRVSYVITSPI